MVVVVVVVVVVPAVVAHARSVEGPQENIPDDEAHTADQNRDDDGEDSLTARAGHRARRCSGRRRLGAP